MTPARDVIEAWDAERANGNTCGIDRAFVEAIERLRNMDSTDMLLADEVQRLTALLESISRELLLPGEPAIEVKDIGARYAAMRARVAELEALALDAKRWKYARRGGAHSDGRPLVVRLRAREGRDAKYEILIGEAADAAVDAIARAGEP